MAQLSNLNRTVQMQNGGSGSLSRLKAVLQGKEVNEDDLPKPQGLPVLEKFKEKMEAAVARKKARNNFGFSFLEKTEIPDWKITAPAKDTFSVRLMREKLKKEEEEKERQSMMELDGVSPKKGRKRRKKAVKAQNAQTGAKNAPSLWRHFILETEHLSRQARDKHRKS